LKKLPTDLQLLKYIYKAYYEDFVKFSKDEEKTTRSTKLYVPIDIREIAAHFKIDSEIIFGRLYYHLDRKYHYKNEDGSNVHLFALKVGQDIHAINFPYLSAILSEMKDKNFKYWISIFLSLSAVIISIISLVLSV
jgi:hypothetical protein